jgi:ketosteroid isomerase-like protein
MRLLQTSIAATVTACITAAVTARFTAAAVAYMTATAIACMTIGCQQPVKPGSAKPTGSTLQAELEAIDSSMAYYYLKGNADSLVGFYDTAFTYLPEYYSPIDQTIGLQKFYTDWFKSQPLASYSKQIYSVEKIADYVLEIGTFHMGYTKRPGPDKEYNGKYMTMWRRDGSGKLTIISEAFGADKYIKQEDMPYASVPVEETKKKEDVNILSDKLRPEIGEFDKGVVKAVLTGDGEARAKEFTTDGIYMPHFDPMQVGMAMLRPYMLKTYTGSSITDVRDNFHEIFDTGDFVFLSGHFKVGFGNGDNKGSFEGHMSNLMKRGQDGKLLMYRQLAHN